VLASSFKVSRSPVADSPPRLASYIFGDGSADSHQGNKRGEETFLSAGVRKASLISLLSSSTGDAFEDEEGYSFLEI
jgi:hypothetical protein